MHRAVPDELARGSEPLSHRLSGTDVEDPDEVALGILVHNLDHLTYMHIKFRWQKSEWLASPYPVARTQRDEVSIVNRHRLGFGYHQSS
jgi:hypothetical protein